MKDFDVRRVIEKYYLIAELKNKIRSGWLVWNVSKERLETVAEHVFAVMHLAELLHSESGIDVDINKVREMLLWHETEEIFIPDYTPYDSNISREEWLRQGKDAARKILKDLEIGPEKIALIDEFDAHETPEAKFAFLCDKFECSLQIKRYSDAGCCTIEGGSDKPKNDPEVKMHIANGAQTVADIFLAHEAPKYAGTIFESLADFLKGYDATTVHRVVTTKQLPEESSTVLNDIVEFFETHETLK